MADVHDMIIIGGGAHSTPRPDLVPYSVEEYRAMWMDRVLGGLDNGFDKNHRALIYVQGPDQWRLEKDWPILDTKTAKLHLRSTQSGSIVSLNDGSLLSGGPAVDDPSVSINYSPMTGPFLSTRRSSGAGTFKGDQRADEANVLTWTTQPLEVATEVTGRGKLTFWAEVGGTDADFVVQITDVAPDGTSTQVTVGYLNASHAHDRSAPTLPEPGIVQKYEMEIWPTSYVFQAGHRIRLDLDGGPKSIELFSQAVGRANTIVWNGPSGVFEFDKFAGSTKAMAAAIAEATKRGATTVVGGGDTATAAKKFKVADQVTHCSTGGGASLEFLEGKALPGVVFLET